MALQGYDIGQLLQEAQTRWLKPVEVHFILQNSDKYEFTQEPPTRPSGGSLFLFNRRVTRFFRKDGHSWRKKRDGRTVGEAHERLKVGNVETLNCYYAHGEENPNFQRRSYWMLDPAYDHIVLVHYREINEGRTASGSIAQSSPGASYHLGQSPSSYTTNNQGSTSLISNSCEPYTNSASPGSIEVTSEVVVKGNDGCSTTGFTTPNNEVGQFFRRLEEQLSLNEDLISGLGPFNGDEVAGNQSELVEFRTRTYKQDQLDVAVGKPEYFPEYYDHNAGVERKPNNQLFQNPDGSCADLSSYMLDGASGMKESLQWDEVFGSCTPSSRIDSKENLTSDLKREPAEEYQPSQWLSFGGNNAGNSSVLLPEVGKFEVLGYSDMESQPDNFDYPMLYSNDKANSQLTLGQHQKFKIQEICPEWGYCYEGTKVLIVGSFLSDPSGSAWACMFGDTEVPIRIIQEGVIQCETPHLDPGKVSVCITSSNRESCSEIRDFEFRKKPSPGCIHCALSPLESKNPEEPLLLVRFAQSLLCESSSLKLNSDESSVRNQPGASNMDDDSWTQVIEALLVGSGTSSTTVDWLLEQLLKDKLVHWLSSKSNGPSDNQSGGCYLSKKEQGIIHMVAGLGFEWALIPILSHGVSVDFRDINGWTALHWAARFGREKMVAALIASGASAGAVTDPNSQDPIGKTPASIAAINGHDGLAGYLSELALTSHLSSLTLEESELSKGSAEVQAERTMDTIAKENFPASEDQASIKNTLAAVRNAAQAAARIQSAFRAHSFRRRQHGEAVAAEDEYGILSGDIQGLSALSKMAFGNPRDYSSAALSIQKKYRGWRGRQDFLTLRQKIVKIQAYVRGYQVRKHYRVICWAVGIIDKVVLRWRRKGAGLRGLRNETEPIGEEEEEDADILKSFRKQKVDGTVDEAVSRVLSMVKSPDARQQYQRMLERYKQAKAELAASSEAGTSNPRSGSAMDSETQHYFQ
ncbi:unnamed protein product [Linum tenue]|uniref:CG-1 domain-containing protein n=2 Tax=Linum tenue TaxID=586396 RepID=A0AAV0H8F6_9ROSI|nr:unnamed protein product [Linum tenue]